MVVASATFATLSAPIEPTKSEANATANAVTKTKASTISLVAVRRKPFNSFLFLIIISTSGFGVMRIYALAHIRRFLYITILHDINKNVNIYFSNDVANVSHVNSLMRKQIKNAPRRVLGLSINRVNYRK